MPIMQSKRTYEEAPTQTGDNMEIKNLTEAVYALTDAIKMALAESSRNADPKRLADAVKGARELGYM